MSKRTDWIEKNQTSEGIKLGIVSGSMLLSYVRYITFLEYREKGLSKEQSLIKTADYLNVGRTTVQNSVNFFQDAP